MATALSAPVASKGSAFGIASFVSAALTVVLPVVVALIAGYELTNGEEAKKHDGWGGLLVVVLGAMAAVAVAGLSSVIGTLTGVVALVRGESQVWRPVIGLLVNVPVTLFVVYLVVAWRSGGN